MSTTNKGKDSPKTSGIRGKSVGRGLGRGLDALIPGGNTIARTGRTSLPISRIKANPNQPRKSFDTARIDSLAASIKNVGLLQAIVVRPVDDHYSIIAGERRYRACKKLGWKEIPVTIQDLDDVQGFTAALIENLQRENLNALEEARGFSELIEAGDLTQKDASERLGVSRSALTNKLRLLTLPGSVQVMIEDGRLTEGHGRALLGVAPEDIEQVAEWAVVSSASVRQIESLGKKRAAQTEAEGVAPKQVPSASRVQELNRIENRLQQHWATRVRIKPSAKGQGGQIVLSYYSDEEFNRLAEKLTRG